MDIRLNEVYRVLALLERDGGMANYMPVPSDIRLDDATLLLMARAVDSRSRAVMKWKGHSSDDVQANIAYVAGMCDMLVMLSQMSDNPKLRKEFKPKDTDNGSK